MTEHFDVAVVGLGVIGSAAAYQAALRGKKVVAFEQFELGHVHGASHDTSRIVRTANATPEYVSLAQSAYKDWADLERATDQKLLTITGGVMFFPKDTTTPRIDFTNSLAAKNVPYELLDSKEVKKRWPQFDIADTVETVYTADTGMAHAAKSVLAMQALARTHGAVLKENTRVDCVTPKRSGTGVVIETSKGRFHASKVILATDAWTNKLLAPLGEHIPLTVMQEQVTYFKPTHPQDWEPSRSPVWIWGGRQNETFYGFPTYGEPTIKVARDTSNNFMTPEQRTYVHSPELLEELCSFMGKFMPDRGRQPLRTITCQYTITPDRQFIISPLENHQDIIVGLGAAHAFKFAPAFGRVLAELAIDGKSTEDISKFGIPQSPTSTTKL
ncbi:FAD dependent oxidoreductase [Penicillium paradoxum]|uniref:FAD dependent oxidoreductase n=1 Tax=Penicillium paradoxum TaxID=176176 RepID=UPI002547511E|nr:FAD dependent oxidoreductase [Penicillium paradoxum]KAJ5774403.1 FAD dependent oxidoreductase [Penicillium paradoxum]